MDNSSFPQTPFDFVTLQNALHAHDLRYHPSLQSPIANPRGQGRVVSPTSLDWDRSSYMEDPMFMNTGPYESFSSTTSTINTPAINTPLIGSSGINTPEDFTTGDFQQRWVHRVNSLAFQGYLETYPTHSPRTISLSERPRSLNNAAYDKDSYDLNHGHHLEPYDNEESSISSGTGSPSQHISIPVSSNCKRKSVGTVSDESIDLRPVKKTAHNMIEKRYRNKLNDSIAELRDTIPSLRLGSGMGKEGDQLPKLYKATVITKAVEHISNLEKEISRLMDEVDNLRSRIEVQKLTPPQNQL